MDKLPRVFANPITKELNNVQSVYKDSGERVVSNPQNISKKINEIFAARDHIYKSKVRITFSDKSKKDYVIVGKTNINLLTIDGKLIKITDIVDIEKI